MTRRGSLLACLPLVALFLQSAAARAVNDTLVFQTKGTPAYAKAEASGYAAYAVVTFVVTRASTGFPVGSLAPSVGDGTPLPALPAGFTKRDLWITPDPIPDACLPVPVYFRNDGGGAYALYLAPGKDPNCAWTGGDYHLAIQFQGTVGSDVLAGTGLADIHIP
ncbi:MAG TPA: hypothetical protein VGX68_19165 [Thermoanaerobaculia bacterium]|jgi:hypothetical protein|nr:hypothetical protein [Thermoanaerobaculia bacterium]